MDARSGLAAGCRLLPLRHRALRRAPTICAHGLELLQSGDWSFTFTATEYASPIFRAFRQHPEGGVEMFFPEHFTSRSQDLPLALHDAGQFYWGRLRPG